MAPRQRGESEPRPQVGEEPLKLWDQIATDDLVYIGQRTDDIHARSPGNANGYLKGHLWFAFHIEISVGPNTEQFVAIVECDGHHLWRHHSVIGDRMESGPLVPAPNDRNSERHSVRDDREQDAMFIGPINLVQDPEITFLGVSSLARLYRFDDFLRFARNVPDLLEPIWIEAAASWLPWTWNDVDRELCALVWRGGCYEGQLPREVIEARAQVMGRIADEYAQTRRCGRVDFKAEDVASVVRIYFSDNSIGLRSQESGRFVTKRLNVLISTIEFGPGIIERMGQ